MVPIKQNLVSPSKYNIKCPYSMKPEGITIHNTANNAPAKNEIAYMIRNDNEVSFHWAVDDIEIIQGIPENRNAWHAGDGGSGKGNRTTISIEICYSTGDKAKFEKAQENAAEFTASKLKEYGWGINKVYTHNHWNGKHCPHRTLDEYGWEFFLDLVEKYLNGGTTPTPTPAEDEMYRVRKSWDDPKSQIGAYRSLDNAIAACPDGYYVFNNAGEIVYPEQIKPTPTPAPAPSPSNYGVRYQVWDDVKNTWLPDVNDDSDYAGIFGHDVCAVYANLAEGNITYAVHTLGGKWLPAVTNRGDYAGIFNKPIDGLVMKVDSGSIQYRVHLRSSNKWLGWISNYDTADDINGFAGILGQPIDAIQIKVSKNVSAPTPTPVAPAKKSNTEIAKEVIAGKWGNGTDRKKKLEAAGYNYTDIQKEVSAILNGNKPKGYKAVVTASALNVRAGAGTNYRVTKVIRKGQSITIAEEKSDWGKLSDGAGWVSLKYVKKV